MRQAERGTVTIGITTMNRPDFCAKLLGQIGAAEPPAATPAHASGSMYSA